MALTGYIKNLFVDKEKTIPLFPRTNVKAVIDDDGNTLDDLLGNALFLDDSGEDASVSPVNADTLGGKRERELSVNNSAKLNGKTENELSVSYADSAGSIEGINVVDFVQKSDIKPKAGFIYPLATPNVPDGFLLCDGAEYSRTEYSELFAAIGTYYGEGDGSTTFNVPNLQTRVPVGAGNGYELGSVGGEAEHTLTVNEMPSHYHKITSRTEAGSYQGYATTTGNTTSTIGDINTQLTGGGAPHNNMQPYTVINYIISTGKDSAVYIRDVINGAQAIPLEVQYGGTGATNVDDARKNLGIREYERNLLDNSDFTNPVNQRGVTSLTTDTNTKYFVDRWRTFRSVVELTADGITLAKNSAMDADGVFSQILEGTWSQGMVYTVAAKIDGSVLHRVITLGASGANTGGTVWGGIKFYLVWSGSKLYLNINNQHTNSVTLEWAALYEGEYTAETLPPYVPKGYTVELLECRRYYRKYNNWNDISSGYVTYSGGIYIPIPCDIRMRTTPTAVGNKFQVRCNGSVIDITATPTVSHYNNVIELFFQNGTVATSHGNSPCYICVADSTFELNADL